MTEEQNLKAIGQGISRSVAFMREVFSEVSLVHKDVERQLAGEKLRLQPLDARYVYLDDSSANVNSPNAWLQASTGRLFSSGGSRPASELVIIEVHLEPGRGIDEPVLVAAVAWWGAAKAKGEAAAAYSGGEWVWTLAPDPAPLEAMTVEPSERVLPGARRIRLGAWALTRLTSSADVQRDVAETVGRFLREKA